VLRSLASKSKRPLSIGHNGTAKMVMTMCNCKGLSSRQLPARTRHCGIRMLAVLCTWFFFTLHCSYATGLREMDADCQVCQDTSTPSQQPCLLTRHARWSPFAMLLRRRCNAERMNCMLENAVRQTHDRKQLAGLKRDYIDETGTYCGMGGNRCRMHAISFSSLPPQSQLFPKIITLVLSHFGTNFRSQHTSLSGILVLGEIAVLVCMSALALITRASTSNRSRNDDDAHSVRPPSVWEDTSVRKRRRRRRRTEDDDDDDEDERAGAGRGYGRLLLFVFLLIVVECFDDVVEDADVIEDGDDIDVSATCILCALCVVV